MSNFPKQMLAAFTEPPPYIPVVLQALPTEQKSQISMTLANDEASTDEEIIELWTQQCGISQEAAEAAIKYRADFLTNVFYDMFPEIHGRPAYRG